MTAMTAATTATGHHPRTRVKRTQKRNRKGAARREEERGPFEEQTRIAGFEMQREPQEYGADDEPRLHGREKDEVPVERLVQTGPAHRQR